MAVNTPQSKAIQSANLIILYMGQFQTLRQQINDIVAQYNSESYGTIWNALPTSVLNPDGTLGTNDGSPNAAHPINNPSLTKVVTANQLLAGITFFNDYIKFLTNANLGAAQRSQTVDDLAS